MPPDLDGPQLGALRAGYEHNALARVDEYRLHGDVDRVGDLGDDDFKAAAHPRTHARVGIEDLDVAAVHTQVGVREPGVLVREHGLEAHLSGKLPVGQRIDAHDHTLADIDLLEHGLVQGSLGNHAVRRRDRDDRLAFTHGGAFGDRRFAVAPAAAAFLGVDHHARDRRIHLRALDLPHVAFEFFVLEVKPRLAGSHVRLVVDEARVRLQLHTRELALGLLDIRLQAPVFAREVVFDEQVLVAARLFDLDLGAGERKFVGLELRPRQETLCGEVARPLALVLRTLEILLREQNGVFRGLQELGIIAREVLLLVALRKVEGALRERDVADVLAALDF